MSRKLMTEVLEYDLPPIEQHILLVLASFANDDGSSCRPSIDRVTSMTGYARKTVWRVIRQRLMAERHVLVEVHPAVAFRRAAEYRIVLAALRRRDAYVPERWRAAHGEGEPAKGVPGPPSDSSAKGVLPPPLDEAPQGRSAVPPRAFLDPLQGVPGTPDPVSDPVINSVKGAAAPLVINDEGFVKAVVTLWRAARNKPGLERFTDAGPIKNLKVAAKRAHAQGCTLVDMERAIAIHAADVNANPWYVDEWAREARAEREEREQFERRLRARAREEADPEPRKEPTKEPEKEPAHFSDPEVRGPTGPVMDVPKTDTPRTRIVAPSAVCASCGHDSVYQHRSRRDVRVLAGESREGECVVKGCVCIKVATINAERVIVDDGIVTMKKTVEPPIIEWTDLWAMGTGLPCRC
jgi:hypothetical protein